MFIVSWIINCHSIDYMEFRRGDYTLALVLVYSKKLKSKGRVFCACCYKRLKLRLQLFRIRHSYNIMIMYCIFAFLERY